MNAPVHIGSVALDGRPRLVAAGGEHEVDALVHADGADVVELRADLFDEPTPARIEHVLTTLARAGRPILLTVRSGREGGRPMPDERRKELYTCGLPLAHAVDVEIASTALAAAIVPAARAAGRTVLLSAHDFHATPPRAALEAWIDQAFAAGADVAKIATHAATLDDVRVLLGVTLARAATPLATLGMGPYGPLSRVVLGAAGSRLIYGSVGAPTAPGQIPVVELAAWRDRLFPA
jgi:3-dehydroquinate dehydratase-1